MKWFEEEADKLQQEKEQRMKEAGLKPFYKLVKGTNEFTVVNPNEKPSLKPGKFGEQYILDVLDAKGEECVLAVKPNSTLWQIIIAGLNDKRVEFKVLKSGSGRDTKYEALTD